MAEEEPAAKRQSPPLQALEGEIGDRLRSSDGQGRPGNLHIELSRDRFDFRKIARNLQPLRGNRREKAFETTWRQNGDPSCTLNDDERVLNASGNVEYVSGGAFGASPARQKRSRPCRMTKTSSDLG
ncbi:hypothetical protein [Mesorhizobium sp.]|uniref:hypothetical protein n=1 Tax=Mesorhizobium sp. TaxID=1871066 RepID=UPI000FE4DDE4|nr:hypothetical protein [Mesorhizobium sp.]RWA72163.1 MAG: hypothetical protein EOQ29_08310 [Mesorhizobium sp.]